MAQKVTVLDKATENDMEQVSEETMETALQGKDLSDGKESVRDTFRSSVSGNASAVPDTVDPDESDGDEFDDDLDSGDLTDMENTGLLVYREKFISKERRQKYWGYFVTGMLRGHKVRVSLVSTDAGGYDLLDIVFNGADSVELWRKPYTLKDADGKITGSGFTYSAVSLDEDGTVYSAQLKPSRKSGKSFLEKIIELRMRSIAREEE